MLLQKLEAHLILGLSSSPLLSFLLKDGAFDLWSGEGSA